MLRPRPIRALLPILCLFLFAGPAGAHPASPAAALFIDSGQQLASANSAGVALGDIDGDSDLDALVANFSGPSTVFVNQGGAQGGQEGQFASGKQALGAGSAQDVDLADLDDDGDLDAVITLDASTGTLEIWINQGGAQAGVAGVFLGNGQTIGEDLQAASALGPLDGNSSPDIWVARTVGRVDRVWTNDGSGQFADSGQALDSGSGTDVALGDVDGDNDLDAFVTNGQADRVWINQGGAQGGSAGTFLNSGQSLGNDLSLAVALADFDGDLDLDAAVGGVITNTVYVNQGGAQGGTSGVYQAGGQTVGFLFTRSMAAADLDDDGDVDIFVGNNGADEVYINQGGAQGGAAGQFASNGQNLGSGTSEGVALGDVDGDGDIDAFVARWDGPNLVWLNTHNDVTPPVNPPGWQHQLVDARGRAGFGASLALDTQGRPHIAYAVDLPVLDGLDYRIFYAHWDGVRWVTSEVVRLELLSLDGLRVALALDGAGDPHLAFHGRRNDSTDLHYATRGPLGWQVTVVDTAVESNTVKANVDLALDAAGRPHFSYAWGIISTELRYATWDGTTWQVETVDVGTGSAGKNNALALDSGGQPHISYWGADENALKYAMKSGGGWLIETVEGNNSGEHNDIVIDALDRPHISYVRFVTDIHYAQRDGGSWTVANVADIGPGEQFEASTAIALDSAGRPRVAYGVEFGPNPDDFQLRYAAWDGVAWQFETLDGGAGQYASMAFDGDAARIAYYDNKFHDLRYIAWERRWLSQARAAGAPTRAASLAVADGAPTLAYHNLTSGQLRSSRWLGGAWLDEALAFVGAPVGATAVAMAQQRPFVAFHNADALRLELVGWNGTAWVTTIIDASGNVGRSLDLVFAGGSASGRIAYWDATLNRVKLARFNAISPAPEISVNMAGPALNANSGFPSVAVLPEGDVGVSYYNGVNGDLRYAVWDSGTDTWSDQLADGALSDAGRYNDLAVDADTGFPLIAYHDATLQAIRLARWNGASWQLQTVVPGLAAIDDLALSLGLNSGNRARIAYIDAIADEVRLAILQDGTWSIEGLAGAGQFADLDQALDRRAHLAVAGANGLTYLARTATLDVASTPFVPPTPLSSYNPLDACMAVLELFTGPSRVPASPPQAPAAGGGLGDEAIFQLMARQFAASAGGQHYIALYQAHGAEMGRLGLADPSLLWDSYGALQNLLPGLEALVTGRGDGVLVTQAMVDDALDIWQRLAAAGSPALAAAINAELAASNDLQDFVGLTFHDWAAAIGVPTPQIHLPVVTR